MDKQIRVFDYKNNFTGKQRTKYAVAVFEEKLTKTNKKDNLSSGTYIVICCYLKPFFGFTHLGIHESNKKEDYKLRVIWSVSCYVL